MLKDPQTGNEYDDGTMTADEIRAAVEADRHTAAVLADLEEVES